jgi:IS5 family transposase
MKPKKSEQEAAQKVLGVRLDSFLNMDHELIRLSKVINWIRLGKDYELLYTNNSGRPGLSSRVMVGLNYLKYMMKLSDEGLMEAFIRDPYIQYFCGFEVFQYQAPCDSSSMTRWRKKIGESGAEKLLAVTIDSAKNLKFIKKTDLKRVSVDTTVQEKEVAFPTDTRLYFKARRTLVSLAKKENIDLRQSYDRVGKIEFVKAQRYAHAKQFKRAKRSQRKLKTQLKAIINDILRKTEGLAISKKLQSTVDVATKILNQERTDKNKIYSVHEPHVECIAKGKAHKRYEFGNKVSVVTSTKSNWVLGVKSFFKNPYDGKTLKESLSQAARLSKAKFEEVYVDLGYKGKDNHPGELEVILPTRKKLSPIKTKMKKRRSAIEPVIGHLKSDYLLSRNRLGGKQGDEFNPILSGSAFNLNKILNLLKKNPDIFLYDLILQLRIFFQINILTV